MLFLNQVTGVLEPQCVGGELGQEWGWLGKRGSLEKACQRE